MLIHSWSGVNMVVIDPDRKNPSVNITLRNVQLGKALDIMRLAEEAAARPGGICLVQITNTFGVTLRGKF